MKETVSGCFFWTQCSFSLYFYFLVMCCGLSWQWTPSCHMVSFCVLCCIFQSMQILKKSDVRPYFIFIAPGSIAKLKQMREQQGVTVTVCFLYELLTNMHTRTLADNLLGQLVFFMFLIIQSISLILWNSWA